MTNDDPRSTSSQPAVKAADALARRRRLQLRVRVDPRCRIQGEELARLLNDAVILIQSGQVLDDLPEGIEVISMLRLGNDRRPTLATSASSDDVVIGALKVER